MPRILPFGTLGALGSFLSIAITACDATPTTDHTPDPFTDPATPIETDGVLRPTSVDVLELRVDEHTLPAALRGDPGLRVAQLAEIGTLVGGQGGLYHLTALGLDPIDADAVLDLAAIPGVGIAIASSRGLLVWNGALEPSPLNMPLDTAQVRAIAAHGDEVWLGTDRELFVLRGESLSSFQDFTEIRSITTFGEAEDIVLETREGEITHLRISANGFLSRSLSREIAASDAVPGIDGRILAIEGGRLRARVPVEAERGAWRAVALTQDEADTGATSIELIATNPETGSVWAISRSRLARIDGDRVVHVARSPRTSVLLSASVTLDGAIWVSDGEMLQRFGRDGTAASYETDVLPFSRDNCERCHKELGVARPLTTYEAWAENIDLAVRALEERRMPLDGAPLLGGTVSLLKQWRADGLHR